MNLPRFWLTALAGSTAALAAAEPVGSPAREAVHEMMIAHAVYAPPLARAPSTLPPAPPFAAGPARAPDSSAPLPLPAHPLHENRVDRFFRTGILLADRPDRAVDKLCVGPCEGGKLLNLRSSW